MCSFSCFLYEYASLNSRRTDYDLKHECFRALKIRMGWKVFLNRYDSWPKSQCLAPRLKKETFIRLRKKKLVPFHSPRKTSAFSVFES